MKLITLQVNGREIKVPAGSMLTTAVFAARTDLFRRSVTGERRFPLCGMGVCFECRVKIGGVRDQRSCLIPAEEGMQIETDE